MHHGAIPAKYNHTKIIPRRLHPLSWMFQAIAATVGCCPRTATRLYSVASTVGVGSRGTHTPPKQPAEPTIKTQLPVLKVRVRRFRSASNPKPLTFPTEALVFWADNLFADPRVVGGGQALRVNPALGLSWALLQAPSSAYHLPELASNPPGAIFCCFRQLFSTVLAIFVRF